MFCRLGSGRTKEDSRVENTPQESATFTRARLPAKYAGASSQTLLRGHGARKLIKGPLFGIEMDLMAHTRKLPRFAPPCAGGTLIGHSGKVSGCGLSSHWVFGLNVSLSAPVPSDNTGGRPAYYASSIRATFLSVILRSRNDETEYGEEVEGAPGQNEKVPYGVVVGESLPQIEEDTSRIRQTAQCHQDEGRRGHQF